ncbi:hypothetical protein GCM10009096_02540 [Parasphingorhabdus litoris]|uniref:Glycosyl transferase n=2 Tax=Parasphingorhabdus litoris TaxID=394733 RepID=A0ABN1A1U4_9SPHN
MQREDFLVSIGLIQEGTIADDLSKLEELSKQISKKFRYSEIVYAVDERDHSKLDLQATAISRISNLRIIVVSNDLSFYRRRILVASETIGDVVLLSSFRELEYICLAEIAEEVYETGDIILSWRAKRRIAMPIFHAILAAVSKYKVNARVMRTIGIARVSLGKILNTPTATVDLVFEPKQSNENYIHKKTDYPTSLQSRSTMSDRFELVFELITNSAPRILRGFAVFSCFVVILAMTYAIYACVVLFTVDNVQDGWFSTAIVQSGSVVFIALALGLLCMGLAGIYDRLRGSDEGLIRDEISNTSFFDQTSDLNVEVDDYDGSRLR